MQKPLTENLYLFELKKLEDKIKVLETNLRGLQELVKEHLIIREYCPHKQRV